jgi:hypothetical protein
VTRHSVHVLGRQREVLVRPLLRHSRVLAQFEGAELARQIALLAHQWVSRVVARTTRVALGLGLALRLSDVLEGRSASMKRVVVIVRRGLGALLVRVRRQRRVPLGVDVPLPARHGVGGAVAVERHDLGLVVAVEELSPAYWTWMEPSTPAALAASHL